MSYLPQPPMDISNKDANLPDSGTAAAPADVATQRKRYHDITVRRVIRETADACSLEFDVPAELKAAFEYASGQFLTLQVAFEGKKLFRCYSLASASVCNEPHKVTIKRVDGGRISNWVNDSVRDGDTLSVLPPAGDFVLCDDADLVLFAGGSGITPVISILKTALNTSKRKIRLVYANRDEASIIFRDELEVLAAVHADRMEIIHRLDVRDGFLDDGAVRSYVGDLRDRTFYMCGPGPFMDTVEQGLENLKIPSDRIHIERFSSPADGQKSGDEAADSDAPGIRVILKLDGEEHSVDVREGETVLKAARRMGLEPPFSCESGFCGCCMAKTVTGKMEMELNDFLEPDELSEGWVLTCQAKPVTEDCTVEYPD